MTTARRQPDFFATSVTDARRFYLDLAPNPERRLRVVCGGYEHCDPDYQINRRTFPYYSIEMVTKGRGVATLKGRDYELEPGSMFSYGPGVPHTIRPRNRARLGKLFVDFVGREALALLDRLQCPPGGYCRVNTVPEVQLLWSELIRDGQRGDESSHEICAELLKCIVLRAAASRVEGSSGAVEPFETYERCVRHITANAATITTQQQAARECGVTPAYLSRLFKRHARQTPYQLLRRLRMNLAAERLLDPTVTVKEIANGLGFSDQFHFSRTFKATLGVSPTDFRRLR